MNKNEQGRRQMQSLNEKKLDADEVFKRWLADVREDNHTRYTRSDRKRHLENLMGYLQMYNVPQDDAQFLKKKVVEALVTKEGMRGQGKYQNWRENTENDFDDLIQKTYVPAPSVKIEPLKAAQSYDPLIVNWCKKKYGDHVGEEFIKAAHQPLHVLWCMCLNETFNRNTGGRL